MDARDQVTFDTDEAGNPICTIDLGNQAMIYMAFIIQKQKGLYAIPAEVGDIVVDSSLNGVMQALQADFEQTIARVFYQSLTELGAKAEQFRNADQGIIIPTQLAHHFDAIMQDYGWLADPALLGDKDVYRCYHQVGALRQAP